ncbi:hypothetical protein B0T19DRAFT_416301 [Cercophora scortea]|uniref:Uncharacterized protein n=1 Tax=Cercophora scortea TaxID=314031 RepID=A0AAE0IWP8_9PEZI|nr:hypothetical protein B0T19DRAFT_416301 [Cercophora scortea]
MWAMRSSYHRDGMYTSLEVMLRSSANASFEATDPRDKVFALMSLVAPEERIEIDYSSSTASVYSRLAESIVRRAREYDFPRCARECCNLLEDAGLQERVQEYDTTLPTWVPDWGGNHCIRIKMLYKRSWNRDLQQSLMHPNPAVENTIENGPVLRISASLIDEVEMVSGTLLVLSVMADIPGLRRLRTDIKSAYNSLLEGDRKLACYARYGDIDEAFAGALAMDRLRTGQTPSLGELLRSVLQDDQLTFEWGLDGWLSETTYFLRHIDVGINGSRKRFAVTRTGFMGLVPSAALPGDYLHVIPGSPVLRALRKAKRKGADVREFYQLVGSAFLHGTFPWSDGGDSKLQELDVDFQEISIT